MLTHDSDWENRGQLRPDQVEKPVADQCVSGPVLLALQLGLRQQVRQQPADGPQVLPAAHWPAHAHQNGQSAHQMEPAAHYTTALTQ